MDIIVQRGWGHRLFWLRLDPLCNLVHPSPSSCKCCGCWNLAWSLALGQVDPRRLHSPSCPPPRSSQCLADTASGTVLCGVIYASEYILLPTHSTQGWTWFYTTFLLSNLSSLHPSPHPHPSMPWINSVYLKLSVFREYDLRLGDKIG